MAEALNNRPVDRPAPGNAFGDRILGTMKQVHESLNARNLVERYGVNDFFRKMGLGGATVSPSRNLSETRQLEQLMRAQDAR